MRKPNRAVGVSPEIDRDSGHAEVEAAQDRGDRAICPRQAVQMSNVVDWMEMPFHPYLDLAVMLYRRGWLTFPQVCDAERKPSQIEDGRRPKTLLWTQWRETRPPESEIAYIAGHAPSANCAMITGKSCGHAFVIDGDFDSPDMAWRAREIAVELFGENILFRMSRGCRYAIIARFDPDDPIFKANWKFKERAEDSEFAEHENAIEIIGLSAAGDGLPFTLMGKHYKTGRRFTFGGMYSPLTHRPEDLAVVTNAQLEEYKRRLSAEFPIVEKEREAFEIEPGYFDGHIVTPGNSDSVKGVTYSAETGLAINGRESYLAQRTFDFFIGNGGADEDTLTAAIYADFHKHCLISGRWASGLNRKIRDKLRPLFFKASKNRLKQRRLDSYAEEGPVYAPVSVIPERSHDEDVAELTKCRVPGKIKSIIRRTGSNVDLAKGRALMSHEERERETKRVADEIESYIKAYLDALWDGKVDYLNAVRVLRTVTGSGKTSTLLRLLVNQIALRGRLGGPVAILTPSYDNISENVKRVNEFVKLANAAGLKAMVYTGKLKGGCRRDKEMRLLNEHGLGAGGMCEADGDNGQREYCKHHGACPAILQGLDVPISDVVFLPTAFFASGLPASVRDEFKAVFIDEACWQGLVNHVEFPLETLLLPRPKGYVTEKEKKEQKLDVDALHFDRKSLGEKAVEALKAGMDVAQTLKDADFRDGYGNRLDVREMIDNTLKLLGRASDIHRLIKPTTTLEGVKALCDNAKSAYLFKEKRFWQNVSERYELLVEDDAHAALLAAAKENLAKAVAKAIEDGAEIPEHRTEALENAYRKKARGVRDMRIQLLRSDSDNPSLRVSWRTKSTLMHLPTMLLDASADEKIVSKLWQGREVLVKNVEAQAHMRVLWCPDSTYSDGSLIASSQTAPLRQLAAAKRMNGVRGIASGLAILFGNGRVIVGSTKNAREAMSRAWPGMPNMDQVHYGACAGLDFAKAHLAGLSVGRLEMPVSFIDGVVAALTYDDDEPELPYDLTGNGVTDKGQPLFAPKVERVVPKRDGDDITVLVPEYPGDWARRVQRQFREENIRQFIGRLRPVYRVGEAPLCVMLGSVLPDDVIVDDMCHSDDLMERGRLWESIRRTGFLDPRLTSQTCSALDPAMFIGQALREYQAKGMSARILRGFSKVKVTRADGGVDERLIGSWTNVVKETEAAYAVDRKKIESVEIVENGAPSVPSEACPVNAKMELLVGSRQERGDLEFNGLWELGRRMLDEPAYFNRKDYRVPAAASGDLAREFVELGVRAILELGRLRDGRLAGDFEA